MISIAKSGLKMYILSVLEILKVKTTLGTLCPMMYFELTKFIDCIMYLKGQSGGITDI